MISLDKPGDRIRLEVWRQGRKVDLTAQLASANEKVAKADTSKPESAAAGGKLGIALRPLQDNEKRASGIREGLVIEDVAGAAARAGVEAGDVLLAVNGTPAKSIDQVKSLIAKSDKSVALLIQRGDDKIFVPVRIG
jgi:serine protease Do